MCVKVNSIVCVATVEMERRRWRCLYTSEGGEAWGRPGIKDDSLAWRGLVCGGPFGAVKGERVYTFG